MARTDPAGWPPGFCEASPEFSQRPRWGIPRKLPPASPGLPEASPEFSQEFRRCFIHRLILLELFRRFTRRSGCSHPTFASSIPRAAPAGSQAPLIPDPQRRFLHLANSTHELPPSCSSLPPSCKSHLTYTAPPPLAAPPAPFSSSSPARALLSCSVSGVPLRSFSTLTPRSHS